MSGIHVRFTNLLTAIVACGATPACLRAQTPVAPITRAQAIESALTRGARLGVARADTAVAFATLLAARALQNPTLSASYSKATPQYHVIAELPLDYPWLRRARIGSAVAGREAAQYRFQFEQAAIVLDVDTTYTRALAALAHARLSRRNAEDADSLRQMAVSRRSAGDASDLDVELATVNAGQAANVAAADSLTYLSAVLDLQTVMGLAAGGVAVAPSDSLSALPGTDSSIDGASAALTLPTLPVAAAEAALRSAQLTAGLQRRSLWMVPSVSAGIETGDPTGSEPGLLPTFGVALPIPILSRNRGPIAQAEAEQERARAELTLAQVESRAEIARATRERSIAFAKVGRDRRLVGAADRVATMSLTAYREGASALANVLEAQRNAREVLGQYVDDLAAAWTATATLRVLTLTPARSPTP